MGSDIICGRLLIECVKDSTGARRHAALLWDHVGQLVGREKIRRHLVVGQAQLFTSEG